MAKKTKDVAVSTKKEAKVKAKAPVDPVKTKYLVRLLNILALLLAITAFLLQLFAVISHHWKWQLTDLRPIISPGYHYAEANVYEDSRLDQYYGLYSREVKVYANNDEQLGLWASTRFPRLDDGDNNLNYCLSKTSSLSGALRTCSKRVVSPEQCHCRRYVYWNWVIFFEIVALILLGVVVLVTALLTTQYHGILKPAGAGLALLAFIFLLVGLILILTHLKRETRSFADAYPHIHQRLTNKLGVVHDQYRAEQLKPNVFHRALRRQASNFYRAYPLSPGQHPYNDTHFQEYSEQERAWVYKPYTSIIGPVPYLPLSQVREGSYAADSRRNTTAAPLYNQYGPLLGYDTVFENTRAGIGWSTILSIIAAVLSLLLALILIFSWLTNKKLEPSSKTVTKTKTTTVTSEYIPIPQDVTSETLIVSRPIPVDYDPNRPIVEAVVTAQNIGQRPYDSYSDRPEPVIVRDVIIRDEQPIVQTTREQSKPVNVESTQTTYRS